LFRFYCTGVSIPVLKAGDFAAGVHAMARRLSAVLMLVVLSTACATPRVVRLDTGDGTPLEYRPATWHRSVEVSAADFEQALGRLVLEEPLTLRPAGQGWLVRTSSSPVSRESSMGYWLGKGMGGPCRPGQPKVQCLSLLDDVLGLRPWEKVAAGLGLSLEPMRESIARALEETMTPQFFAAAIGAGLVSWAILAANPEPVFTKAAALVAALMVLYLGVDTFIAVVRACQELRRACEEAVTPEELEAASQRFAETVGPQVARVFILAVTVVVSRGTMGGATWLAARLPLLPSFAEVSAVGSSQVGIVLEQVGEVSLVAVVGESLAISLAPTAVAMVARGTPAGGAAGSGFRSWGSYSGFRSAMGSAGEGKQWHHIVEQTPGNVERFGPHSLQNTENVIPLDQALHARVSAFYSSIREGITRSSRLTVRQWLSTQSYEEQRRFGLLAIENVRKGLWR
jgi:hypothetical protein